MDLRNHIRLALVYLFIISLLGAILRYFQIADLPITYKFTLHGHSHIALLGWVYTSLTTIIYRLYLKDRNISKGYRRLFYFTQFTILGMMVTFPFMGYAIPSIVFSTLFLFASYGFLYLFLTHTSIKQKRSYSYKWIRMALWFMVTSSMGPWVLGFIMNTVGGESPWYRNAIYFYLHFQYNGWFVVALIGMLFFFLEKSGIPLNKFLSKIIFWTFNSGVILTFFLSILWMKPHGFYYLISGLGGILQLISFLLIVKILISQRTMISRLFSKKEGSFLKLAGVLFLVKLIIQFLGAYPEIATLVSSNKDMIIGYLHWVFLGIVSISIFAFAVKSELMKMSWMAYYFYLIGFFITEFLLFYKGIMAWQTGTIYEDIQLHLFIGSLIVSLSAAYIFLKQLTQKQN